MSRIALAVLVTLALGLGMTALAGSASASSSATACSSQHAKVVKAKKHVAKDRLVFKKAKRHHHKSAVKKAKKRLARDRAKLARAKAAYRACMNPSAAPAPSPSPSPAPAPAPTPNPVTEQCLAAAGQLTAQDPTGQFGAGAAAFCDLLGQVTATLGGDPTAVCGQLAAQDPTGQFAQICTALGSAGLPSLPGLPGADGLPSLPGTDVGVIGSTLEGLCNQIAAQDPSGQLNQVCTGLGALPI